MPLSDQRAAFVEGLVRAAPRHMREQSTSRARVGALRCLRQLLHLAEVQLAGAEHRELVDVHELVRARHEQRRQPAPGQLLEQVRQRRGREGVGAR